MELKLKHIKDTSTDFKICECCGGLNLFTNEDCSICMGITFKDNGEGVIERIMDDYLYYMLIENRTEEEADEIWTLI